jgi:hypothetical protein
LICFCAAAAYAGDFASKSAGDLKWTPNPQFPEVSTAVAWGDPATGAHGSFHRFKAGFAAPLHTHTAAVRVVVTKGTLAITSEDGKETKLPAGSFFSHSPAYKHSTKCQAGADCEIYVDADAKWDVKPVAAAK